MPPSLLLTAANLFRVLALGGLGVWSLGRLLSDRWEWSQYVYWVPTPVVLGLTGVLLLISAGLRWWSRRNAPHQVPTPGEPPRRIGSWRTWGSWASWGSWAAWVMLLGWMVVGEWHAFRWLRPPAVPGGAVRVLFWNPVLGDSFAQDVISIQPDIAIITNAPARADWLAVRRAMGTSETVPAYTVQAERFTLVTRYPVSRWGFADLGIEGAQPRSFIFRGGGYVVRDTGQAMFAELATPAGPLTLWVVDLPSDFNLSRWTVMRRAGDVLEGTVGRVSTYRRTQAGFDEAAEGDAFPVPQLIVGDFNTPRGSASFSEIAPGMDHAFDQAGAGYAATWPRRRPIFAIDQAFVGRGWRAASYHVVDFGEGQHRAEVMDLKKVEP